MYGPPPDPRQALAPTGPVEAWYAWVACVVVGLAIALIARPRRPFLFVLGMTIALTTPFAWFLPTYVYGAFPTTDKAGSLLFYLQGVHRHVLDAGDPAVKLIGVHVGHLWVTAFFDLFLQPFAAMNAQGLCNLVLNWWCAFLLLRELSGNRDASLLFGGVFGLGLHVFRDLNWYTIEKSGVYWLPLFAFALARAHRDRRFVGVAAAVYLGGAFYNLYWGVLNAAVGALALLYPSRNVRLAVLAGALAGLPLVALQLRVMQGPDALGDPETFLTQRAALDVFEVWPPRWNRLEAWRALDLVALGLAAWGTPKNLRLAGVAAVSFVLSLGPQTPVYTTLVSVVPGLWRFAKPETFFHLTWLALLAIAARTAPASPGKLRVLAALMVAGWLASVRTHPVYPRFTQPVEVKLAPDWQRSGPKPGTLGR
ncbi:MAG: hypothetical protein ACOZNI_06135 [Myxococcota bacterium]